MYHGSHHHNTSAMPGGPSPVGSHNTPSPQAHSEDGDEHIRNNNVLKRPSPDSAAAAAAASGMRPGLPGAQGIPHHHHAASVVPKKPKVSKRKKKRDPNEPQKPVSAYALFFRDSQANIKLANPNAAFGDVSKIVASMWDGLDPDNKAAYKKRTENAKKEYLKKLAAYRASLVSKGGGDPSIYGPYAAYAGYGGITAAAEKTPIVSPTSGPGYGGSSSTPSGAGSTYMHGQPIPPRPPMHHGTTPGAGYMPAMQQGHQVKMVNKYTFS